MQTNTLIKLVLELQKKNLPLDSELAKLLDIEKIIDGKYRLIEKKIKDHEEELKCIRKIIREEQAKCSHLLYSYYGDAAGGSDSFYKCNICDKEW